MVDLKKRQLLTASSSLAFLSMFPWQDAEAAEIIDVRTWPAEEYTRVAIESDKPLKADYFVLRVADPVRLVVDIHGLKLTSKLREIIHKVKPNDPYIERIRCGQFKPDVVRITVDFKQDIQNEIFQLKPAGNYKYRLVFDIYPKEEKDPILAIIKKEEEEPLASQKMVAQVAEGQKRMEQNRLEAEGDQLEQILAGIQSGTVRPVKPELPKGAEKSSAKSKTQSQPQSKRQIAKNEKSAAVSSGKSSSKPARTLVVMIDPGHGGEDPGALGKRYRTREKDVVLSIARILRTKLNQVSGVKAYLTRDRDYFVPLQRRVQKARAAKADFFVSIHADAWVKATAKGSSLFVLNTRGKISTSNRWLAKNQNNADLIGGVNLKTKDKQIAKILMDMSFTAQINDSMLYGAYILTEMSRINTLHKKKVEQANFAVLKAPDIPSVLVETAFLSNPEEERKLRTRAFQEKVACSIGNGILKGFGRPAKLA